MELVLYAIISWMVITYLIFDIKKEEVIRSIIIYFIFTILTVSCFTLISVNLQFIQLTHDKTKFISLMISRNIIVPFLTIISVNYFYRFTQYKKIVPVILWMVVISILECIHLKLQIYSYIKWSFGLTFLGNTLFIFITLAMSKGINIIQLRSE